MAAVAIKRLTPTVRNLGHLRLWRDDVAEIAGFAEQLRDVKLRMEADDNALDDVQADLPKIGKRLRYFTLTATRTGPDLIPEEVLKVRLAKEGCYVAATNPDLETRGIISDIESAADRCRRVPRWLTRFSLVSFANGSEAGSEAAIIVLLLAMAGIAYSIVAGITASAHFSTPKNPGIPWPASIISGIVVAVVTISVIAIQFRMRTLLFTGTRADAPTRWQEYKGHVFIAIVSGAVFLVLGLLIH
jgi:hypothetical protein